MPAESFADVLDAALGRLAAGPERVAPFRRTSGAGSGPGAPAAFLFGRPLTAAAPRWPAVTPVAPRRPNHNFSDAERAAFNRLLDLGARLEANFSADDLRREYRRLAKLYHPDRQSSGNEAEPGRFPRLFAELTERYRSLRALVEPRH